MYVCNKCDNLYNPSEEHRTYIENLATNSTEGIGEAICICNKCTKLMVVGVKVSTYNSFIMHNRVATKEDSMLKLFTSVEVIL